MVIYGYITSLTTGPAQECCSFSQRPDDEDDEGSASQLGARSLRPLAVGGIRIPPAPPMRPSPPGHYAELAS
jgi:hypothetical protein